MPSLSPESNRALLKVANGKHYTAEQVTDFLTYAGALYELTGTNPMLVPDEYLESYERSLKKEDNGALPEA